MTLAPVDWRVRSQMLTTADHTLIMGVLNVTPDSFSDGGAFYERDAAVERARALIDQGADIVDIGGESTRPGATPVGAAEEIERVVPVLVALRALGVTAPLSVDTTKAEVAAAALAAGADIVNDISGGLFDPDIIDVTSRAGGAYILGHVRGRTLDEVHAAERSPRVDEVTGELVERVARLPAALGRRTVVDPCLGFGKALAENLGLIRHAGAIARATGCPILIGPSRKRFVRALVTDAAAPEAAPHALTDAGTVGACLAAVAAGAHFLRIHDIQLLRPALMVYEAITGTSS